MNFIKLLGLFYSGLAIIVGATGEEIGSETTTERPCLGFTCPNSGKCIPIRDTCDGRNHCEDAGEGSDESDEICPRDCFEDEFKCPGSGICIPISNTCDGWNDCGRNEDESDEICPRDCFENEFFCTYSKICIPIWFTCDGDDDCGDNADERKRDGTCPRQCFDDEFTCTGRKEICIPESFVCDGDNDCGDWSDENGDACCEPPRYRCPNGPCIPDWYVCDGEADCPDWSDEGNCTVSSKLTMSRDNRNAKPKSQLPPRYKKMMKKGSKRKAH